MASLVGKSADDRAFGVFWDAADDIVLVGQTLSADFPVTSGESTLGGVMDGFMSRMTGGFDNSFPSLKSATFHGGSGIDAFTGVSGNTKGDIFAIGLSNSDDFPFINATPEPPAGGYDATITAWNNGAVVFSRQVGSPLDDILNAVDVTSDFPTKDAHRNHQPGLVGWHPW